MYVAASVCDDSLFKWSKLCEKNFKRFFAGTEYAQLTGE